MYEIKRTTKKFNTDETSDMEEYDAILNNPLCSIVQERKEKLSHKEFSDGEMISLEEYVILVVTWEEKELIL